MKEVQEKIKISCVQVIIKVKDMNKQTTQKRTIYGDNIRADITDPQIDAFIAKVQKEFGQDPMTIKTSVTLKLLGDE